MAELEYAVTVLFGVAYGACIGSFAGMLAYRLPKALRGELSSAHKNWLGRSACTYCQATIPIKYNVPVLSFLVLKAKTKCCSKPLSPHYFFFELACAIFGGLIAAYFFAN